MSFIQARWVVAALVLCILLTAAGRGETFVHPGGAFQFAPPAGFVRHAFVHDSGVPLYVFTPDPGEDAEAYKRGIWVYAFPLPTDDQLDPASVTEYIANLLTAHEPDLVVKHDAAEPAKLGGLKAVAMSSEGKRAKAGPWKGKVIVAAQDDCYLVCSFGGPPDQWAGISALCEAALNTFVAPVKAAAMAEPAVPRQTQRARDVSELLTKATPLIHVPARKNAKDVGTLGIEAMYGSGFIIHPDGYVITNRHVVESHAFNGGMGRVAYDSVRLTWDQGLGQEAAEAEVVAISRQYDLALLKIRGERKWPCVPLADIKKVRLGDQVIVAGWPDPNRFGTSAMSLNEGSLIAVLRDEHGRATEIRHGARTTGGNSGGPLYDLEIGAVVGAHFMSYFMERPRGDAAPIVETLYYGAVPVHRILWEFPQVATDRVEPAMTAGERDALIAYYFLQHRYGAAMIEARKAVKINPKDGLANAYMYRIFESQMDGGRAEECLQVALSRPESRVRAMLMASDANVENGKLNEARVWSAKAMQADPYGFGPALAEARAQAAGPSFSHVVSQNIQMHNMALVGREFQAKMAAGGMPPPSLDPSAMMGTKVPDDPELLEIFGRVLVQEWMKNARVRRLPSNQPIPDSTATDAKMYLTRSMELWPGYRGICRAYLATLAYQEGQATRALELREQAIKAAPQDPDVRLAVAQLDLMRGDPYAANENVAAAMAVKTTPRALYLRGWVLSDFADMDEASGKVEVAQNIRNSSYQCLESALKADEMASYWQDSARDVEQYLKGAFRRAQDKMQEQQEEQQNQGNRGTYRAGGWVRR